MKLKYTLWTCCCLFLGFQVSAQTGMETHQQPVNYRKVGAPLPELKIIDLAGVSYTKADITEDRNFILVMFKPTCGHCVDVAKMIMANKSLFEDNTVMFMASSEMMQYIPRFMGESDWESGPNFILGVDDAHAVDELYNYATLPQINVYNPGHQLIKILGGDVQIEELREYLK